MFNISDKTKAIIKGIIVFIIFYSSSYIQYIPVKLFNINIQTMSITMKAVLSTFASLVIVFILFILYRKDLKKDFKDFWKNKENYFDIGIRYWVIGLVIMLVSNFILNFIFKTGGANNEKIVQTLIKAAPLLMFIDAGILAPFTEEIVFRKTIKDVFKNKWVFVILSFILFGGAHVISSSKTIADYLYIIPYGSLGASLALAYYKTNNIFTSISMHTIHNVALILLSIVTTLIK